MTTRTNSAKWMGTRWQINVQKDGQRKSFYSSKPGRTGQREANAKADKWLETGVAPTSMRVEEAYALWYATQQQTTGEGNCQNIASRWRQWIGPNIGRKKLSNLTEQDLQNVVNKAHAAGLSKRHWPASAPICGRCASSAGLPGCPHSTPRAYTSPPGPASKARRFYNLPTC